MGARGPKPQPTVLRLLKGNPGKRKINKAEPKLPPPRPKDTDPPSDLTGPGLAEWKRLVRELVDGGVLTSADMTVFAEYCRTITELAGYRDEARKVTPAAAIASGVQGMVVKLRAQLKQHAAELGITPSSRSGVKAAGIDEKKSKLARFTGAAKA